MRLKVLTHLFLPKKLITIESLWTGRFPLQWYPVKMWAKFYCSFWDIWILNPINKRNQEVDWAFYKVWSYFTFNQLNQIRWFLAYLLTFNCSIQYINFNVGCTNMFYMNLIIKVPLIILDNLNHYMYKPKESIN